MSQNDDVKALQIHADRLAESLRKVLAILDRVERGEAFTLGDSLGNTQDTEQAEQHLAAWDRMTGRRSD